MTALRQATGIPLADESRPFLAFAADTDTAELIARVAAPHGFSAESVIIGNLDDAIDGLAGIRTPSLLMVDLGHANDIMVEAERLAQVCDAGVRVVLLGEINDLRAYRDLLAAGVADYLVKPLSETELDAVFARGHAASSATLALAPAKIPDTASEAVCIIGVRGGVGASTIAANAAWLAADSGTRTVTLIDMDLTFGTQALILDIDPGGGLSDAMKEPGRMDELFVKRASVTLGERFRVMAAETDPAKGDIASAEAFKGLLKIVLEETDLAVVDVPRMLCVAQPNILEPFQRVVLVAEPGLAAMRDSARLAALVAAANPSAKVSVMLNRQGLAPKYELSRKTFEDGAGLDVAAILPFDPKSALGAEAAGKCVAQWSRRSRLGRAMVAATATIVGADETATGGGVGALLRRVGKRGGH